MTLDSLCKKERAAECRSLLRPLLYHLQALKPVPRELDLALRLHDARFDQSTHDLFPLVVVKLRDATPFAASIRSTNSGLRLIEICMA